MFFFESQNFQFISSYARKAKKKLSTVTGTTEISVREVANDKTENNVLKKLVQRTPKRKMVVQLVWVV